MYTRKDIPIKDLLLDQKNFRFPETNSQIEALQVMIDDQGMSLINLASDIVEAGTNPINLCFAIPQNGKYIIVEGNRRLTVLKLLSTPSLLDKLNYTKPFGSKITELSKAFKQNPLNSLFCVIAPTREDAQRWINLIHTGENEGVGTVVWDAQQVDRFIDNVSGKPPIRRQALIYLETHDPQWKTKTKKQVEKLAITNFERLITDPTVKNAIGWKQDKGWLETELSPETAIIGFKKIIDVLVKEKLTVDSIKKKPFRERFVAEHLQGILPKPKKKSPASSSSKTPPTKTETGKSSTPKTETSTKKTPTKPKPKPKRSTMIPIGHEFSAPPTRPKDSAIYWELRTLELSQFEISAAVLFRLFLETSLNYMITKGGLTLARGIENSTMQQKLAAVFEHLRANNLITRDEAKAIRPAIQDVDHFASINTLNAYVHNPIINPDPDQLRIAWNNFEPFFNAIWQ